MRKHIFAFVFLAISPLLFAQQALNNDAIIKLVTAGVSDDLIITTINLKPGNYDISDNGMVALKNAKVSDKVIAAIHLKASTAPASPTAAPESPASPLTPTLAASGSHGQAKEPADLQHKLNSSFKITTLTPKTSNIAVPGDIVELHKDGLRVSAVTTVLTDLNIYKDGKIGGGGGKRAWGTFGTVMMLSMASMGGDPSAMASVAIGPPPRILKAGERCWILAIAVQKDAVQFKFLTDPDLNGIRYHGDLRFPFPNKKQAPTPEAMLSTIAEVLTKAPAEPVQVAVILPFQPQHPYEELAPPPPPALPPPPPPPPVVTVGESRTQVITDFGQPQKKAANGTKETYFYTDKKMKVTFIDGKVSSIN